MINVHLYACLLLLLAVKLGNWKYIITERLGFVREIIFEHLVYDAATEWLSSIVISELLWFK